SAAPCSCSKATSRSWCRCPGCWKGQACEPYGGLFCGGAVVWGYRARAVTAVGALGPPELEAVAVSPPGTRTEPARRARGGAGCARALCALVPRRARPAAAARAGGPPPRRTDGGFSCPAALAPRGQGGTMGSCAGARSGAGGDDTAVRGDAMEPFHPPAAAGAGLARASLYRRITGRGAEITTDIPCSSGQDQRNSEW